MKRKKKQVGKYNIYLAQFKNIQLLQVHQSEARENGIGILWERKKVEFG